MGRSTGGTMYRSILIATDGSELSSKGLQQGLALAARLGAPHSGGRPASDAR